MANNQVHNGLMDNILLIYLYKTTEINLFGGHLSTILLNGVHIHLNNENTKENKSKNNLFKCKRFNLLYTPCPGEECCRCTMNHEFLQISLHYWHKSIGFSLPMLYYHHRSDHFWFSQDPECK